MVKYESKHPRRKGKILIISLAVLCLCILSGSTLAYLITGTGSLFNSFAPGQVSCEVVGADNGYAENVKIKNTGNVPAYIRVAIVVTFEKDDGKENSIVSSIAPDEGDYRIQFAENTNWKKGVDGYWYYTEPVAAADTTQVLITYCGKNKSVAPQGYQLTIEVIASAIQASGTKAVTESWSSGVKELNGSTLVIRDGTAA